MDEYQMTIDDMQFAEMVAAQPGRSAFIDESGSFGFDFTKEGTSLHYVVCAVIVDNENIPAIEKKVKELQSTLFGGKEMKSSSIGSNHSRRAKVLTELQLLDFQIIVMIADKRRFYEDSGLPYHLDGAIRAYDDEKMLHRLDVNLKHADRNTVYTKLWRVDQQIPVETWKELITHYYRDNHLIGEYFGGTDQRQREYVEKMKYLILPQI